MIREIRDLGFEFAELSHGVSLGLVPGILDAVTAGEIKISTLHNFCPLPVGVTGPSPNVYEFTSDDPRNHEAAVKNTLRTLDFAVKVKAPLVVLHLGRMELKDYGDRLKKMLAAGERATPKYEKLLAEAKAKRESRKKGAMERLYATLKKLVPEAEKRGLRLGCENREAVEELLLDDDFENFFRDFDSSNVAYWHDCGHGQIKENLGFIQVVNQLDALSNRLAGFHIHDVQFPARDHCPPGAGMIDFAAIKPFVRPEHIKVFELSPRVAVEDLQKGVAHLKSIWGE